MTEPNLPLVSIDTANGCITAGVAAPQESSSATSCVRRKPLGAGILRALRSGEWLTAERARSYSLIILAIVALVVVGWVVRSEGLVDHNGKPIGTDFSSFYTAGALALEGKPGDAYNMAVHHAREQQLFGANTPYYGWLYPPNFFMIAAPLALLPYPVALAVWQGVTLALYLIVIAGILRRARCATGVIARLWLPIAAAFPAVFVNLGHGQNGFLSASLLGSALLLLPGRPMFAGALFGLLAYKPQLALLVPVALVAGRQWRAIAAATVTALALASVSAVLFGADTWGSFLASTETSRKLLLEASSVGFEKLQTAFAAVRMWGGDVMLAYTAQGAISTAVVGITAWVWHSSQHHNVRAALLIAATVLASPHILDYDLMLLAPAIAFFVADRSGAHFKDYEISLLAAVWIAPLFARPVAGLTGVPMGLFASLTLFVLIVRGIVRKSDRSRFVLSTVR